MTPPPFLSTCPVRGTTQRPRQVQRRARISIHVPREGHDDYARERCRGHLHFLSACPVRGTTRKDANCGGGGDFSIRVPREGHDITAAGLSYGLDFSIRVPREGHDKMATCRFRGHEFFYPRAP